MSVRPVASRPDFATWLRWRGFADVPERGGYEEVQEHTSDPRILNSFDGLRAEYLAAVGLGRGVVA